MNEDSSKLYKAIRGQITARGYTQKEVALRIGINPVTMNKKLNQKDNSEFTLNGYVAIANSIGMSFKQLSDIAALQ